MHSSQVAGVGVIGHGTVGGSLVETLRLRASEIAARTGIEFQVRAVAVRNKTPERIERLGEDVITDDAHSVVVRDDVDVVVELMGGIEPARSLVVAALSQRKAVVTANKELIAACGEELIELARSKGVDLLYEAAVAGGIPVVRSLRESLGAEDITRVVGIVNGTTNYMLTRMSEDGLGYDEVLAEAQSLGYAEADPTADVGGLDAAAKAAIIANVAFGSSLKTADVFCEGITSITKDDMELASRLGFVIKLVAVVSRDAKGRPGARVHPMMLPKDHPLASVRLSFNALFVEGATSGELMFYGRGAGGGPTASAVLGDLVDAAHNKLRDATGWVARSSDVGVWPIDEQSSPFYLTLDVADQPGVLAAVARIFGENNVSIRSMEQLGLGSEARLVFVTHEARELDVRATLDGLAAIEPVRKIGNVIRVMESV